MTSTTVHGLQRSRSSSPARLPSSASSISSERFYTPSLSQDPSRSHSPTNNVQPPTSRLSRSSSFSSTRSDFENQLPLVNEFKSPGPSRPSSAASQAESESENVADPFEGERVKKSGFMGRARGVIQHAKYTLTGGAKLLRKSKPNAVDFLKTVRSIDRAKIKNYESEWQKHFQVESKHDHKECKKCAELLRGEEEAIYEQSFNEAQHQAMITAQKVDDSYQGFIEKEPANSQYAVLDFKDYAKTLEDHLASLDNLNDLLGQKREDIQKKLRLIQQPSGDEQTEFTTVDQAYNSVLREQEKTQERLDRVRLAIKDEMITNNKRRGLEPSPEEWIGQNPKKTISVGIGSVAIIGAGMGLGIASLTSALTSDEQNDDVNTTENTKIK